MAKIKKEAWPNYITVVPVYLSIQKLWSDMQEQDSCLQSNQIAIEFLEKNIALTNVDPDTFISSLAKKYSISSGSSDWADNKKQIAESYIILTTNVAEFFFKELKKEMISYGLKTNSDWVSHYKYNGNSKRYDFFNEVLANLSESSQATLKEKPEYYLINYYRMLRNSFVHRDGSQVNDLDKYYRSNILPRLDHFKGYYKFIDDKIPAPNSYKEITFRDFILYSRSLRYYSRLINQELNLNGRQIYLKNKKDKYFKVNLPRLLNGTKVDDKLKNKLKTSVTGYLKRNYKLYRDEDVESIMLSFLKDRNLI